MPSPSVSGQPIGVIEISSIEKSLPLAFIEVFFKINETV
jgi:hypothetical protein